MKKKQTIAQSIAKRLNEEFAGLHKRVALAAGLAQMSVSRMSRCENSPTLRNAEKILNFFEAYDAARFAGKASASTPHTFINKCVASRANAPKKAAPLRSQRE